MSSDWFFGSNRFGPGGPAYHGGRNDHPAAYDRTAAILTLAAVTLYLPFVLSVVTARRRRIPTFLGWRDSLIRYSDLCDSETNPTK